MRALFLDHQDIRERVGKAKQEVGDFNLERLSRDELMAAQSNIQQVISGLTYLIEEHAHREEVILDMLQKVLKEKAEDRD